MCSAGCFTAVSQPMLRNLCGGGVINTILHMCSLDQADQGLLDCIRKRELLGISPIQRAWEVRDGKAGVQAQAPGSSPWSYTPLLHELSHSLVLQAIWGWVSVEEGSPQLYSICISSPVIAAWTTSCRNWSLETPRVAFIDPTSPPLCVGEISQVQLIQNIK